MNLALNARDAMPDGGVLRFRTTESRLDATDPRFAAFRLEGKDFVRIDVMDEGSGIEPEILEKIFDPFFTTKAVGKGTGLGLSLLYTYVREVGGALEVCSEVGVGTTVSIFLPVTLEKQMKVQPVNSIPSMTTRETILLAEDDQAVSQLLCAVLSDAGYEVVVCEDGRQAVESFSQTSGLIRLVLLDYRMPRMDGIEAFDEIHSLSPTMPVILMSGNIPGSEIAHLRQRGLCAVLRKPCSREEVLHAVRAGIKSRLNSAHGGAGVS
jgi:CheY-like chemotaxis protein